MQTQRKMWLLGAALMVGAFTAIVLAGSAAATQTGNVYGGSGTWTISTLATTVSNENVAVSGDVSIQNSFSMTNASITFTVNNSVITVQAPNGALNIQGAFNGVTITTSNTTYRWSFVVQNVTGNVVVQNATMNYINNGIQVSGGSASSRYFADDTFNHALNYGIQSTDSSLTIMHVLIYLDAAPNVLLNDYWSNTTYDYGYYGYSYKYHYYNLYWWLQGTGVQTTRGSPWIDGIEVHVPSTSVRVDVAFPGSVFYSYDYSYSYGCGAYHDWYNYTYAYGYFYEAINFYGFQGIDSKFANFANVKPPTEDISVDIHYTFTGAGYGYYYNECQYGTYTYTDPNQVVYYNYLYFGYNPYANPSYANNLIGVYIQNAGLASLTNLNASMGKAGISLTMDWNGAQYYKDYFTNYNLRIQTPLSVYALWSLETVTTSTFAAVTSTSFSLTNSIFTGAGVRVERTFNYNTPVAPNGANNTVFRGTMLVDNVTVLRASATGVDVRMTSTASSTMPTFDYTAIVSNSTLAASQPLSLSIPNAQVTSNYTASVNIINSQLRDAALLPSATFRGAIFIDTGGHPTSLSADWFKVNVLFQNNTITNISGPFVGLPYSYYKFQGGGTLTLESNTLTNVRFYSVPNGAGGFTPGKTTDAFIKTNVDTVNVRNNTFNGLKFVNGILGGPQGADPSNEYLAYSYCAQYGYLNYGCSWPYKTPTIDVSGNTFEGTSMETAGSSLNAFALVAGRGHLTFNGNMINNSTVEWVHAFLNDYTYYAFPVTDIDIQVNFNHASNQTGRPFGVYTYPFKTGQPYSMTGNVYQNSKTPFITWKQGWYSSMGYPPSQLGATFVLVGNTFLNLSLGGEAAAHMTGKMTIVNNTFDGIFGWAIIMDKMLKIPSITGNQVTNSANGFWFSPAVSSGLVQTTSIQDIAIDVTDTGIRMENGNLVLLRIDFANAATAVDMRNGYAEVYSSKIRVLSGRVQGDASITVYNNLGYEVRWANADGVDSGVLVNNALIVTSTPDQKILSSGHTGTDGRIAPKTIEVWQMVSFGSVSTSRVDLPLNILVFAGGISEQIQLPQLGPGEAPSFFQDYPAYPILLVDPVVPEISIGKPLPGEVVGHSDVEVQGYTFERGSGIATQRVRLDGGAWINVPSTSATWTVLLTGVSEGRHVLEVEVADVATNSFTSQLEFFVDITPPTLTLNSPLEERTLTNQPVFDVRGHVDPVDSLVAINGVALSVTSRGDFFYNYSLADGLNVLRFTATDEAGNQVVVVRQIDFDRYAPFLQVDEPVNGLLTNHKTVDVSGRSERDAIVSVNGLLAFVNPIDGTFLLPEVALDDLFDQTENLLVIKAVDKAGNAHYENRTVIVDTKAPSIDLSLDDSPPLMIASKIAAGEPIPTASLTIQGRTDSTDAKITIAGQDVPLTGLSFSRAIVLREGLNVIRITSLDKAGNTGVLTLRVTRDTVRPVLTLETPAAPSLLTNQSTLLVTGFTDSPDAILNIDYLDALGRQGGGTVLTAAVGIPIQYRFEYNLVLVTDGNAHVVTVRAVDLAGNYDQKQFTYTAKVNKPFLEINGFKDKTTDTFVWINGTTEQGIDKVRINGQEFDVVGQGFSVRWNLPIEEGNYSFTVSVRDQAGNANVWQNRVEVHAAPPPPPPATSQSFLANPSVQVGIGAGLFGIALAVLAMALARRRETE